LNAHQNRPLTVQAAVITYLRLTAIVGYIGLTTLFLWLLFPVLPAATRHTWIRTWARYALFIIGVRLRVQRQPVIEAVPAQLFIANHISWLDILLMHQLLPVRFVAKSDVRTWPLVGRITQLVGTLYIDRASRRDMNRVNTEIAACLQSACHVMVFPEGTTSDGRQVLPFHAGLLQAAVVTRSPIQAIAIRYLQDDGQICDAATYHGDKTIWQTLRELCAQPRVWADVTFMTPVLTADKQRRELATITQQYISEQLRIEQLVPQQVESVALTNTAAVRAQS